MPTVCRHSCTAVFMVAMIAHAERIEGQLCVLAGGHNSFLRARLTSRHLGESVGRWSFANVSILRRLCLACFREISLFTAWPFTITWSFCSTGLVLARSSIIFVDIVFEGFEWWLRETGALRRVGYGFHISWFYWQTSQNGLCLGLIQQIHSLGWSKFLLKHLN